MGDKNYTTLLAPLRGEIKALHESKDRAVAQGLLGRGILIEPVDGAVYAPCDGRIVLVYPTKHAIIIKSACGVGILIHIGNDTSMLNGEGFESYVEDGQWVKAGDLLLHFDLLKLKNAGLSLLSPFVFPDLKDTDFLSVFTLGEVAAKTPLIGIKKH